MGEIFGVVYPSADGLGETGEEVNASSGKLITTNEMTVIAESFLTRLWWGAVRAMDIFPAAPMRATGSRFSASQTISSTGSLRPKQSLGGGVGGVSPGWML